MPKRYARSILAAKDARGPAPLNNGLTTRGSLTSRSRMASVRRSSKKAAAMIAAARSSCRSISAVVKWSSAVPRVTHATVVSSQHEQSGRRGRADRAAHGRAALEASENASPVARRIGRAGAPRQGQKGYSASPEAPPAQESAGPLFSR